MLRPIIVNVVMASLSSGNQAVSDIKPWTTSLYQEFIPFEDVPCGNLKK